MGKTKKIPEFITEINWGILREQKDDILAIIGHNMVSNEYVESLEGLLNLIDDLQDYAVDELGISEKLVFNLDEEKW